MNFSANFEKLRLMRIALAVMFAPAVTLSIVAFVNYGKFWMPILFVFGYVCFLIVGMPALAIAIRKRTLLACVAGGGISAMIPIIFLYLLSMTRSSLSGGDLVSGLFIVFMAGAAGGLFFWVIAFAGRRPAFKARAGKAPNCDDGNDSPTC